jgi:hypothetical protein
MPDNPETPVIAAADGPILRFRLTRGDFDGGWVAQCDDLPGCVSQGDSVAEALANVGDAYEEMNAHREGDSMGALAAGWWKCCQRNNGGWNVVGLNERAEIVFECLHFHADRASGITCGRERLPHAKGPRR